MLRPVGVGLLLQNSPLRALRSLGLADAYAEHGYVHREIDLCDGQGTVRHVIAPSSSVDGTLPVGAISRALLADVQHAVQAAGAQLRLGTTATELTKTGDSVQAVFADGATERFDVVVGADGLHSWTRAQELPTAPSPSARAGDLAVAAPRPAAVERYSIILNGGPSIRKAGIVPISRRRPVPLAAPA